MVKRKTKILFCEKYCKDFIIDDVTMDNLVNIFAAVSYSRSETYDASYNKVSTIAYFVMVVNYSSKILIRSSSGVNVIKSFFHLSTQSNICE
jgi:hypothetical protein